MKLTKIKPTNLFILDIKLKCLENKVFTSTILYLWDKQAESETYMFQNSLKRCELCVFYCYATFNQLIGYEYIIICACVI